LEGIGTPIGGLIFINFKGKGEMKMRDKEKEKGEMKFSYETSDGYKSIDRKIKKLIAYVNDRIDLWMQIEAHKYNNPAELENAISKWAAETIRRGIKNIAENTVVYRVS